MMFFPVRFRANQAKEHATRNGGMSPLLMAHWEADICGI
jgi:hypothetical protein